MIANKIEILIVEMKPLNFGQLIVIELILHNFRYGLVLGSIPFDILLYYTAF